LEVNVQDAVAVKEGDNADGISEAHEFEEGES
jgi:hypothetical protein